MRPLRRSLLGLLLLAGALVRADPVREAWELAARMDFGEARARFERLAAEAGPRQPEARFGLAMCLLSAPPITAAGQQRAETLLRSLAAGDPAGTFAIQAEYFLARCLIVHRRSPDLPGAYRGFDALARRAPDHPAGQMALLEAAMIDLYHPQSDLADADRIAAWRERFETLRDPATRRSALTILGDACVRLTEDASLAARLYAQAASLGFARADYKSMILFRVARFAEKAGDNALALEHLARWRREFAGRGYGPVVDAWEARLRRPSAEPQP